jgi:hypothetical protein
LLLIDCLLLIGLFIIEFDGLVLIDNFWLSPIPNGSALPGLKNCCLLRLKLKVLFWLGLIS